MPAPNSMDLRCGSCAVERRSSIRAAARRFAVSPSASIKLMQRVHATGSDAPERYGGHRRPALEPHEANLRRLVKARPDITLAELQTKLQRRCGRGPRSRRPTTRSAGSACGMKKVPESGRAGSARRRGRML
jgi:hypothetical protein